VAACASSHVQWGVLQCSRCLLYLSVVTTSDVFTALQCSTCPHNRPWGTAAALAVLCQTSNLPAHMCDHLFSCLQCGKLEELSKFQVGARTHCTLSSHVSHSNVENMAQCTWLAVCVRLGQLNRCSLDDKALLLYMALSSAGLNLSIRMLWATTHM
jgi:hypothetical protein